VRVGKIQPDDNLFVRKFKLLVGERSDVRDVACRIGVTPETIKNWLRGSKPSKTCLGLITAAYDVGVNYFNDCFSFGEHISAKYLDAYIKGYERALRECGRII
jgi:hypothetical protein